MSDWEEIKRLAADFQKVQLSVSAQKLSERNCVEIISWLIEKKLVDLIFTSDGKEYLTPAQLVTEIQNELYVSGGRINLGDVAKNIGVDFGQVSAHLNQVLKGKKDVHNVLGQLVDSNYTSRIAGEINEKLQQQGHVNVSDLTIAYDLPADFLLHQVLEKYLGTIIQAIQDPTDPKSFFIESFIARTKAQLRGALNGLSRPISVGSIISQIGISEKLFFGLFDQNCAYGSLTSRLPGAQYIPNCYTRGQNDWSRTFLKQNHYLEFDALARIGISDPKSYLKKVHASDQLVFLDSMAVSGTLLERVDADIEECIASGSFVDLESSLPSSITATDLSIVVDHLIKGRKHLETVLLDSFVLSKTYMDRISELCSETVQQRAKAIVDSGQYQKHQVELQSSDKSKPQRGKEEEDRVDKRDERRKKATGGKSGGGTQGRETKTKSTKKHVKHKAHDEHDDDEEESGKRPLTVVPENLVVEMIQGFLEEEGLESLLGPISQYLQPKLNERGLQLAGEIFKEKVADKTALRRKKHSEFASKVENLVNELRWYQKGTKLLPAELQGPIIKYLLKSVCTDMVTEFLNYAAADQGSEVDTRSFNASEKLKFLNQNSDYAPMVPLVKSLSGDSLEDFVSALESALDVCSVYLKKVDKKQDRAAVLRVKMDYLKELESCEDPAAVLHLATLVLFSTATQCLLHISGKHIAAVLGFLRPQLDESQYSELMNYHDFVALMLSGGSEVENAKEKLKEQMEAVKSVAREYKRGGNPTCPPKPTPSKSPNSSDVFAQNYLCRMDAICGKIALITGGANGIGAAYVKRLFQAGMQGCTVTDVDEKHGEALVEEMNNCYGKGKAIFLKGDMSDKAAFECAFKENMKKFKQLDLLINNAGILRDKVWEPMINLNVTSTVYGTLLGIKYMGRNNGGCGGTIVNTASILGLQGLPGCPCYTGTKHFVVGFTRSIGTQFWFDLTGIRFLTICPGVTVTPLITDAEQWVFEGFPGLGKLVVDGLKGEPSQTVEDLAEGLNTILNEGENGSIWVGEGAKPIYQVVIPPIHAMKVEAGTCKAR